MVAFLIAIIEKKIVQWNKKFMISKIINQNCSWSHYFYSNDYNHSTPKRSSLNVTEWFRLVRFGTMFW